MVTVEIIQRLVARHFNISVTNLLSTNRVPEFSHPRMVAMYFCYEYTGLSSTGIGRRFNRHHTTVLHAYKKINGNLYFKGHVEAITEIIIKESGLCSMQKTE